MSAKRAAAAATGLAQLCEPASPQQAIAGDGVVGIERMHMALDGRESFSPHRHDTLAVGLTLRGVQTFVYRGERRYSLPGDVHVLAPDELHDGTPGTEAGFEYRIIYLDPALLVDCLGPAARSFSPDPILRRPQLDHELGWLIWGRHDPVDTIGRTDTVAALSRLLAPVTSTLPLRLPIIELERIRELLDASVHRTLRMSELERASGLDRWSIARGFRSLYGTSPSRYRVMRRLAEAKREILSGAGLAQAAYTAGFSDQSHLTRQFRAAFGLSPGQWAWKVRNQHERSE
jgi:AraC-like DNA-binding protein